MASLPEYPSHVVAESEQPLTGVGEGEEVVACFTRGDSDATAQPQSVQETLRLIGAWSDRDWKAAVEELDRIRHGTQPAPPIAGL